MRHTLDYNINEYTKLFVCRQNLAKNKLQMHEGDKSFVILATQIYK